MHQAWEMKKKKKMNEKQNLKNLSNTFCLYNTIQNNDNQLHKFQVLNQFFHINLYVALKKVLIQVPSFSRILLLIKSFHPQNIEPTIQAYFK